MKQNIIDFINKEVDLVLVGLIPSPERAKIFDLTCPLMYDDYRIMVKWPEEMDRWTEVARPFDSIVNKNKQKQIS